MARGDKVTIRGSDYYYEGEFFWDYWDFFGGLDGELIVRYGSPKSRDYSGQGFIGRLREALAAHSSSTQKPPIAPGRFCVAALNHAA